MDRRVSDRFIMFEGFRVRIFWVEFLNAARTMPFWVERDSIVESMHEWMIESHIRGERGERIPYNVYNGVRWMYEAMTNVTPQR